MKKCVKSDISERSHRAGSDTLFISMTKFLKKIKTTLRKKDLFWLTVAEVSIYGQLAPLF
jgi:hypothetical protein